MSGQVENLLILKCYELSGTTPNLHPKVNGREAFGRRIRTLPAVELT
jgi:hypothetical protein